MIYVQYNTAQYSTTQYSIIQLSKQYLFKQLVDSHIVREQGTMLRRIYFRTTWNNFCRKVSISRGYHMPT